VPRARVRGGQCRGARYRGRLDPGRARLAPCKVGLDQAQMDSRGVGVLLRASRPPHPPFGLRRAQSSRHPHPSEAVRLLGELRQKKGMVQERPFSGNTRVLQRARDRARVVAGHSEAGSLSVHRGHRPRLQLAVIPDFEPCPFLAWFKNARFRVTLGLLSAGHDRARVVAGLCEAGRSRIAGVTDPGYNWRCYLALNHAAKGQRGLYAVGEDVGPNPGACRGSNWPHDPGPQSHHPWQASEAGGRARKSAENGCLKAGPPHQGGDSGGWSRCNLHP
jgi:hypothetical protein